jgi:hypothetical protein
MTNSFVVKNAARLAMYELVMMSAKNHHIDVTRRDDIPLQRNIMEFVTGYL